MFLLLFCGPAERIREPWGTVNRAAISFLQTKTVSHCPLFLGQEALTKAEASNDVEQASQRQRAACCSYAVVWLQDLQDLQDAFKFRAMPASSAQFTMSDMCGSEIGRPALLNC